MLVYPVLNNKTVIQSDYLEDSIYNLLDETFIIPAKFSYNIFEVTDEYIARPDLIALDAYGDVMFADIICKINGISNPFELNTGYKLVLPTPDCMMDFARQPENTEDQREDIDIPIAKNVNQKRKPNEAIIGDSRFRVDPVTGVIIY